MNVLIELTPLISKEVYTAYTQSYLVVRRIKWAEVQCGMLSLIWMEGYTISQACLGLFGAVCISSLHSITHPLIWILLSVKTAFDPSVWVPCVMEGQGHWFSCRGEFTRPEPDHTVSIWEYNNNTRHQCPPVSHNFTPQS